MQAVDEAGLSSAEVVSADHKFRARSERTGNTDRVELLVLAALMLVLIVVVFANSWGLFAPDTKPQLYFAPGRTLIQSLHSWLPSLGQAGEPNVDTGLAPVAAVVWVIRSLGASAWVAMRIMRLIMYFVAGWGIRRWFGAITEGRTNRAGRLAITVFYVANPFVIVSGSTLPEMLPYALLPWLLLGQLASIREPRSMRKATLFALAFVAMSGANSGIIPLFLLLAVPCQLLYARVATGVSWRDLWSSLWRCGVLSVALSLYWLIPAVLAFGAATGIVAATENPLSVAQTTSWAEVARGLGLWPLYGRSGLRDWTPAYVSYLSNPVVAAVSYLVPAVAALAAWFARSRTGLLAGLLLAIGLPVMVGQYPPYSSLAWSRTVGWVFANVPGAVGFRTTDKVGPVVVLAYALCIGVGAVALAHSWGQWSRLWRWSVVSLAVAAEVVSIAPAFTGNLYDGTWTVPGYWFAASATLNARANTSRVLVVPGSVGGDYQWGMRSPDDILPSLLTRPTTTASPVAASGDRAANFMAGWDTALNDDILPPRALSVVARYLGASEVLVRNDTRYQETGGAPPSVIEDEVNADGGLTLKNAYGRPGEYTTPGGMRPEPRSSPNAAVKPLEIYNVSDPTQIVRAQPTDDMVLVDGDGFALPSLAALGILNGDQPFQYMGDVSPTQLERIAADGATIVLTDTNRRRSWGENEVNDVFGPTLAANEPIDQSSAPSAQRYDAYGPSLTLFQNRVETQTVTRLQGAVKLTGTPRIFGTQPDGQPEQAFDPSPAAAFLTGGFGQTGMSLTIELAKAIPISTVYITSAATGPARATKVRVTVGHRVVNAALHGSKTTPIAVPTTTSRSLTIAISGVSRGINPVGLSHIQIPGVTVSQVTVLPSTFDKLFDQVNGATRERLAHLPLDVILTRQLVAPETLQLDEEQTLDRVFNLPQARRFTLTATAHSLSDLPTPVTKSLELTKPGATSPCFSIGHIDGRPLQMAVTVPLSRALSFGTVSLTSCHGTALDLAAGRHEITTLPGVIIDQITLASSGDMRPIAVAPPVHVTSMSDTRVTFSLGRATQPYYIVAGQAYSSGWHATLDGRELGPPVPLDGYTFGWHVNELGPHEVVLAYGPQQATNVALGLSAIALLVLLGALAWPLLRRPRRHRVRQEPV